LGDWERRELVGGGGEENRRGLAIQTRPMTIGNRDFFRIFCQGGRSDISGWALPPLPPLSSSFTPPSPLPSLFPGVPPFLMGYGYKPGKFLEITDSRRCALVHFIQIVKHSCILGFLLVTSEF
jgi:hypothetical protein